MYVHKRRYRQEEVEPKLGKCQVGYKAQVVWPEILNFAKMRKHVTFGSWLGTLARSGTERQLALGRHHCIVPFL
jgi:hypothetical protein